MQAELQMEEGSRTTRRGTNRPFASVLRSRRSYAILLATTTAALIATAVHYYRTIDRELTAVALSRRATVTQLAAATLSEKFARLVDLSVSLATRVRFRELVAEGKWVEASVILRDVPRDFPFIERLRSGAYAGRPDRDPKLILPDIKLPRVDGIEVLKRIKADERTRVVPVVMVTSSAEGRDIAESYHSGVNSYVVNPVEFEQFSETMAGAGRYRMLMNKTF